MFKTNNEYKMNQKNYEQRTMETHPSEVNRKSNKKKKMEQEWTHIM